jgi:hypothetical protein
MSPVVIEGGNTGDTVRSRRKNRVEEGFMYRDAAQWQHIRRRILINGTPKKQVARDTGISRKTINKMLKHQHPPGLGRRPPL